MSARRADLAAGLESGRLAYGADAVTIELVTGTLITPLRRPITDVEAIHDETIPAVASRPLVAIGIGRNEADH